MASDQSGLYVLNARGRPIKATSIEAWQRWHSLPANQEIKHTKVHSYAVFTLFVGRDENRPSAHPECLWELRGISADSRIVTQRFATKAEALCWHNALVKFLRGHTAHWVAQEATDAIARAMDRAEEGTK